MKTHSSINWYTNGWLVNTLVLAGRWGSNCKIEIFIEQNISTGTRYEVSLSWMLCKLTNEKSTLVEVMAWCCQAANLYLSQCWPRSLLPYGTRSQWDNPFKPADTFIQWSTRSSLVQVVACCLFDLKPSPEPMLTYCQLHHREQTSVKFQPKCIFF